MKKLIILAFASIALAACSNNNDKDKNNNNDGNQTMGTETRTETTTTTTYTASEGDVTRKDGKVLIMKNGVWVDIDDDVKLDNGVVIYRTGRATRDGKEVEIVEGEYVNRNGDFFDRTGNAIENGWDRTKEAVKEAGRDIDDAVDGKKDGK